MKTQPLDLLMTWRRKKKASQGEKEPLSGVGLRKKMKGVLEVISINNYARNFAQKRNEKIFQ